MYIFKIFPEVNLIIVKFENGDVPISDVFKDANKVVHTHPDYKDHMNIILDYRKATLPHDQSFYNDMTRKVTFDVKFNKIIRYLSPDMNHFENNLKVFNIFYNGPAFKNQIIKVNNTPDALKAVGLDEDNSKYIDFLDA